MQSSEKRLVRWCWRTEFASRQGRKLGIPTRLSSPSFAIYGGVC